MYLKATRPNGVPPKRKSRLPGWQLQTGRSRPPSSLLSLLPSPLASLVARRDPSLYLAQPLFSPPPPCQSIHPSPPLSATPSPRMHIASVRSQLSGPDVFSDKSFSGALVLLWPFTIHLSVNVCVSVISSIRSSKLVHHLHYVHTYWLLIFIFVDLHGYLLIHPSFIHLSIHCATLPPSHPCCHAVPATSGLLLAVIARFRLVRTAPSRRCFDALHPSIHSKPPWLP